MAILGAIILCIIVYFKFYRKFKRMKTELAHVHYIADPIQNDRHHFDNPVYSTSYRGAGHRGGGGDPGAGGAGVAPAGAPVGVPSSTHLPLNNGCSRVVNHFAPTCATAKKHVNIEREKLAAGGGTAAPNHYHDDIDTEEEEHENGAFGCTAGAFSYSTLSNRKNLEADAQNPNLYSSLENLKDNRKMENLYDELSKKATASATVPRRGRHSHGGATGNGNSATGSVSTSATAHPGGGGEYSMEKIKMSYDKLDFSRPAENLKPHYHSSSTLRSSKSKEFTHTTPKAIGDQESLTASNEPMVGSGYTPIAILNDPSARKCSSGHLSQAAIPQIGDLSQEVLQSLGHIHQEFPHQTHGPRIVPRGSSRPREPDSGISSARSTNTVPWSQNELEQPANLPLPILELPRPESLQEAEHQF